MDPKSIVVTGAGGYLGSVLVPLLLDRGYRVIAVDRFYFGSKVLSHHERLSVLNCDVRELNTEAFEGAYAVIDMAAISNDPSATRFEQPTWEINRDARVRNARLAREAGVSVYLLTSSCSVYGRSTHSLCSELRQPRPLSIYARANAQAEQCIEHLVTNSFTPIVARLATLYGPSPRMRYDLALNTMTKSAHTEGWIEIDGDGQQERPFLHVSDAANAIQFILEHTSSFHQGIVNVGANAFNKSIREIADLIVQQIPENVELRHTPNRDRRSYRVDFSLLRQAGWNPAIALEDGIRGILQRLRLGELKKTKRTINLDWYEFLAMRQDPVFP